MTDEEIEKNAEDWYKNTVKINEWNEKGVCTTYMPNAITGFIAGVKLMQKENDRLANQLEKAKEIIQKAVFQNICYNCDYGVNHCDNCHNGALRKQAEQFLKE